MDWSTKTKASRYPAAFDRNGRYRGRFFSDIRIEREQKISSDTQNRKNIIEEISRRCQNGEKLEEIASEIAQRKEIKEQFDYYIKNGITDLALIFANWYKGQQKSIERDGKTNGTR